MTPKNYRLFGKVVKFYNEWFTWMSTKKLPSRDWLVVVLLFNVLLHKLKLMQTEKKCASPDLKIEEWFKMMVAFIGNYSTLEKEHVEIWHISWWLSLR